LKLTALFSNALGALRSLAAVLMVRSAALGGMIPSR
jgi:hypothetical protein